MIQEPYTYRPCMYCGASCPIWVNPEDFSVCRVQCRECRAKARTHVFTEVCPKCHVPVNWQSGSYALPCDCLPKILQWAWVPRSGEGEVELATPPTERQDHSKCCG